MSKAKFWGDPEDGMVVICCPGCQEQHHLRVIPKVDGNNVQQPCWGFNGNLENPTFSPSLLVRTGKYVSPAWGESEPDKDFVERSSKICHSFINSGMIQFLGDCTHPLVGQTVPLLDVDEWTTARDAKRMAEEKEAEENKTEINMEQRPSVTRMVHYYPTENEHLGAGPLAAIIVKVWSDVCVNLSIFPESGGGETVGKTSVTIAPEPGTPGPGTWVWPPRV